MTNFGEDGLLFNPEAPSYLLKEQLTEAFSEEKWFVAAGTTRVADNEAAFLMVDQLVLSPKQIFVGFFQDLRTELRIARLSAIYLDRDSIFFTDTGNDGELPLLVIEMSLGGAQRTSTPATTPTLSGGHRVRLQGSGGAGTLATTVRHSNGPMLLTNQHVLGAASIGDPIEVEIGGVWQVAGQYEGGSYSEVQLGPVRTTIDAGLARIQMLGTPIGGVRGFTNPVTRSGRYDLGTPVQKVGACTGLTMGAIDSMTADVKLGSTLFRNQIRVRSTQPFQQPGDSGSLLLTTDSTPRAVGLLHAQAKQNGVPEPEVAFASHWAAVAYALDISL